MPPRHRTFTRSQAIRQARRKLEAESYPRLQMSLIAALTGAFGLLSSFGMLTQGVDSMALRYPLAVLGAGMVACAPGSRSVGEVVRKASSRP